MKSVSDLTYVLYQLPHTPISILVVACYLCTLFGRFMGGSGVDKRGHHFEKLLENEKSCAWECVQWNPFSICVEVFGSLEGPFLLQKSAVNLQTAQPRRRESDGWGVRRRHWIWLRKFCNWLCLMQCQDQNIISERKWNLINHVCSKDLVHCAGRSLTHLMLAHVLDHLLRTRKPEHTGSRS